MAFRTNLVTSPGLYRYSSSAILNFCKMFWTLLPSAEFRAEKLNMCLSL